MKHILETDGLFLRIHERTILTSVYMRCDTGQVTGLLGRNGAGKTCLMNIIYGRLPAQSRSVRFDGEPLLAAWKQPERVRYAPQFNFVPGNHTLKRVFDDFNVNFERFGRFFPELSPFYHTRFKSLSGGHRRLAEIYVILCSGSEFIMLDEPFSHIMPAHVATLQQIIQEEKASKGILISDHLYREVGSISDRLYLLEDGHLREIPDLAEAGSYIGRAHKP